MAKHWKRIGFDELKEGMVVRGQGYRVAFQARVKTVVIDKNINEGMAVIQVLKKNEATGEEREVFWYNGWGTDKLQLFLVDYSYLKGLSHNKLKIDRANRSRHLKYLETDKGKLHEELEKEKQSLLKQIERINKILEYI